MVLFGSDSYIYYYLKYYNALLANKSYLSLKLKLYQFNKLKLKEIFSLMLSTKYISFFTNC